MKFNNSIFYTYVIFKNITLTNGFGYIFMLAIFLLDRHGLLPSLNYIVVQIKHMFPTFFQCFHVKTGGRQFWPLVKFTKPHRRHDALQGAHVRKVSVCVTFFAP